MSYLQSMQVSDSFEEINERLAIVFQLGDIVNEKQDKIVVKKIKYEIDSLVFWKRIQI